MPVPGPKEKKERALGVQLGVKGERCASPKCAAVRKPYPPGMHGKGSKRGRKKAPSDFGRQLKEKQKFKVSYGVSERGLRRLFGEATKSKGATATKLWELLERRLDNVVYRMGFAPSRGAASQAIGHGHIVVNGDRVRSPGFQVSLGDKISIREVSRSKHQFGSLPESLAKYEPPVWISVDPSRLEGEVKALPEGEIPFEINLLVESFSA